MDCIPRQSRLIAFCTALLTAAFHADAQTLPSGFIEVPSVEFPSIGDRQSIGTDTTLNVLEGGTVGNSFAAGSTDGTSTSVVVSVSGGDVGIAFNAYAGTTMNITGGSVGVIEGALVGALTAHNGSSIDISGGTVGDGLVANPGSIVRLAGGTVGRTFEATQGSNVELVGGDFRLDGVEYTGESIFFGRFSSPTQVFSGTLADGSTFAFLGGAQFGDELQAVSLTSVALPPIGATPRVVDSKITEGPSGLRQSQRLDLLAGGELRNNFTALDATLNIEGGTVGRNLESVGSTINVSGGVVGDFAYAYAGSEVNLTGGQIGGRFESFASVVNVSGGSIGNNAIAHPGSIYNLSGGGIGSLFATSAAPSMCPVEASAPVAT